MRLAFFLSCFLVSITIAQPDSSPPAEKPTTKQPPRPPTKSRGQRERDIKRADELAAESLRALMARDYPAAEKALREQLEIQPGNFVTLYNLACIRALQSDTDGAADFLSKSIENGFCDLRQLEDDPQLAPVRQTDFYKGLMDKWPDVLLARRDANLKLASEMFKGPAYTNSFDERLRLAFRCGVDSRSAATSREELGIIADWADKEVMPGILDRAAMKNDAHVIVVLPTRFDFNRWAFSVFGATANNGIAAVGGSYEHDLKRLVTQDLGASLRHEFFHVLHWRSCTRLGQAHPIWIQEGLCSLVEDFDVIDGRFQPSTSWRSNTCKRMDRTKNMLTIAKLAEQTNQQFNGPRRLGLYAHARTVFLYMWQQGKLMDWYRAYTDGYETDRSGVKALERVFDKPVKDIDSDFKAWLRELPDVPEQVRTGMASLGIDVDAGEGEGPVVASISRAGSRLGLTQGDILTGLGNHSVRDLPELIRLLGTHTPGEQVTLSYRRGKVYSTVEITLVAAE